MNNSLGGLGPDILSKVYPELDLQHLALARTTCRLWCDVPLSEICWARTIAESFPFAQMQVPTYTSPGYFFLGKGIRELMKNKAEAVGALAMQAGVAGNYEAALACCDYGLQIHPFTIVWIVQ